ncbi:MAG TPA: sulfotransferase [Myxococcota bacterium]|nr:sulfotransferase [Myxococcota bacterium]
MSEPLRFAFLVYLGRSGSTYLSRQLDGASQDVLVTPELNFIVSAALAGDAAIRALSPEALLRFVRRDLQIANLDLSDSELDAQTRACAGQGVRALAETLVRAHAARRQRSPRLVVIKKSVAHLAAGPLAEVFPEVVFIHIRRDARAVVNSLIHTESVYDPGHMLGRGDPIHAARLWVKQLASVEELARRHPERVIEVRYESLIKEPAATLESLVAELAKRSGVELRGAARDAGFAVPERERGLHKLVSQEPVEARAESWQRELARGDGIAVESVAREWLERSGYPPYYLARANGLAIASARARAELAHAGITARHYAWRARVLTGLLFRDPGLAAARLREGLFQRFGR